MAWNRENININDQCNVIINHNESNGVINVCMAISANHQW